MWYTSQYYGYLLLVYLENFKAKNSQRGSIESMKL